MKCCNPRCCANWIYTTCYSSTFTSAGFSPPLVILVISPSSSISVHPGFFPTIRPIPCIFAYFIIYGTIVHGDEFCEFHHVEETYLEECYDLRANEVDSFAFFSPLLRPFFFLIIPFNPVTLTFSLLSYPSSLHYSLRFRFASEGNRHEENRYHLR